MNIINNGKTLNTRITNVMKRYREIGPAVHEIAVSALWHAATYGQPGPLNAIHESLRENDRQALKLFIRRASAMNANEGKNPDGLPAEQVQTLVEAGKFLAMEKGKYLVVQGHTTEVAKSFAKLCEDKLIAPDGKDVKYVLDGNNVAETQLLGDSDILKKVVELKRALNSGERKVVTINDKTRTFVEKMASEAESMLEQLKAVS